MKKVLIFDFGGTIVTDESDDVLHMRFYKEFINRFNIPAQPEEMFQFLKAEIKEVLKTAHEKWENLSMAYTKALEQFLKSKNIEVTSDHLKTFRELYLKYHEKFTEPFPDAVETLFKLKSLGFRLAIISNIDNEIIEPVLKKLGIYDIFEVIVTSEELGFGKPNIKIFEETLKRLGISSKDAIFIGDSYTNDVEGAKKAGMDAIHFGVECKNWKELFDELLNRGVKNGCNN
uniref:HAD family hydrolase n=1 Tax=candidate division WOR-3 bacterium TaxID=2052148 RepID=A0A7C2PEW0_UNCW3